METWRTGPLNSSPGGSMWMGFVFMDVTFWTISGPGLTPSWPIRRMLSCVLGRDPGQNYMPRSSSCRSKSWLSTMNR